MSPRNPPLDPAAMGHPPNLEQLLPAFAELVNVIARLRSPTGCPWDRQQTLQSIKPYTLEETYELLEAIDSNDNAAIAEELGDVLLQVLLDSQIAQDEQRFTLVEVVTHLSRKLVHRHPHVFGTESAANADDVLSLWQTAKQAEKQRESIFDGLPRDLPALARAARLSDKAARQGYDFPQRDMLFDKLREEVTELQQELYPTGHAPQVAASINAPVQPDTPFEDAERRQRAEGELGDVLFVIANIARRWHINPEEALRASNQKFERRVRYIEAELARSGRQLSSASLDEMERLYQQGKQQESKNSPASPRSNSST